MKIGVILLVWVMVVLVGVALWYVYKIGVQSGSETAAPVLQPSQQAKIQPSSRDIVSQELNSRIYERIDDEQDEPVSNENLLPPPEEPVRILQNNNVVSDENVQPAPPSIIDENSDDHASSASDQAVALLSNSTQSDNVQPSQPAKLIPLPVEQATPQTEIKLETPETLETVAKPLENTPKEAMEIKENQKNGVVAIPPDGSAWRIQIAALKSPNEAQTYWKQTKARFPNIFEGLGFSMEQTQVQGKDYFRVRGGPLPSRQAAVQLCANLMAQGQACIIVKPNQ